MFHRNRYTFLSLLLLTGMFMIYSLYYDPASPARKFTAMVEGSGEAKIGGPFELVTGEGKAFTQENLRGQFSMIFFGFTFCPDICPQGLSMMASVYDQLDEKQQKMLQPIFVSLDPERDDQEVIQEYVEAFHKDMTGLTGTLDQVKDMANKYLVYRVKNKPDEDGNYMISHSGYVYLMGPDGKYVKHFDHRTPEEEVLTGLRKFLQK